jgi:NAD(P)-dependent dehydrogenase (short-subunit alcohol dehydrogenase family)
VALIVVTGASRGIGEALVKAFRSGGGHEPADVIGLTRADLDVTSNESVKAARAKIDQPIDILINNAGMTGGPQRAPGFDLQRAQQIMDVNAMGPLRVYDAFADLLRRGRGLLINVSSEAGSLGRFRASGKPEYAMSKAALNALTLWIAARDPEVFPVSIHPGWTKTATGGNDAPQTADETAEKMVAAIDALKPEHRGGFFDTNLQPIPW